MIISSFDQFLDQFNRVNTGKESKWPSKDLTMTIKWPLSGCIVASGHLRFINVWIGAHWSLLVSCQTSAFWLADRPYRGCWLAPEWQLAYFRVLLSPLLSVEASSVCLSQGWWQWRVYYSHQNNLNGFRFTQLSTSVWPGLQLRLVTTNHNLIVSKAGPVITECELLRKEFEMYLLDNY